MILTQNRQLVSGRGLALAVAVAWVAVCDLGIGPASAFETSTQVAPAAGQQTTVPGIEIVPQSSARGSGLELTMPGGLGTDSSGSKSSGVAIPGFGTLPKLDFGLELLYGTPDQGSPNGDQNDTLPDALTVHGAVKKTF